VEFFGGSLSVSQVAYQLRIKASVLIPGAAACPETDAVDLQIRLQEDFAGSHPLAHPPADFFYVSPNCNEQGHPTLRVGIVADGAYFVLVYGDGVRFAVNRSGSEVWMDWPETSSLEDAATYLMGPVLGYVMRRRGIVSLHASSVTIGDRAIAFVGEGGAGKSTTAATFACLGYSILSDDLVPLVDQTGRFFAQPGYPRVNLWPDSVRALFGSEEELPRISPTWEKRFLALDQEGYRFQANPIPLGAVYYLVPRDSATASSSFETMNPSAALITLVANTYVNYLLDAQMRSQEFSFLSRLVAAVPVRSVKPANDPSRVREFAESIAADAREIFSAPFAGAATGPA
jgi:hypothetical protein